MVLLSSVLQLVSPTPRAFAGMTMGGGCVTGNISVSFIGTTLKFGTLDPCTGAAGDVEITPKNGNVNTGGCFNSTFGGQSVGAVRVVAGQTSKNHDVTITIEATATIAKGGNTMTLTGFDLEKNGRTSTDIKGTETVTIPIGGVLNVGASQAVGTYTGSVTVTATCL